MTISQQLKDVLVKLAASGQLPDDLTTLDTEELFDPILRQVSDIIIHPWIDCHMALEGTWDKGDDGFEASLEQLGKALDLLPSPSDEKLILSEELVNCIP